MLAPFILSPVEKRKEANHDEGRITEEEDAQKQRSANPLHKQNIPCFLVQISIQLGKETKKVAKSLLGLSNMPARTLNDFFAGFSYGRTREDLEVHMAIPLENDRRRSNRRQSHRRKGNMEAIKIGGDVDKGREVIVHYGTSSQRKQKTTFSWFEEFTIEWSETFILQKQKTTRRENE